MLSSTGPRRTSARRLRTTHVRATHLWFTATAGIAAVGTLAGCAGSGESAVGSTDESDATASESSAAGSDATSDVTGSGAAGSETYADGTYTAVGGYISPSGQQSIEVTLTLADEVVSDVEVVSQAEDPQSQGYQEKFISGIAEEVVGVPISELAVDKVAGSSLTGIGFNDALAQILADAAA